MSPVWSPQWTQASSALPPRSFQATSLSLAPVQNSQAETSYAAVPTSGGTVPLPSPDWLLPAVTLDRDGPFLRIHTEPSMLCHLSPHTCILLTPGNRADYRTVHCPGGHGISPGDPSALTGRAAPSRSTASEGRSVCLESILTALRLTF